MAEEAIEDPISRSRRKIQEDPTNTDHLLELASLLLDANELEESEQLLRMLLHVGHRPSATNIYLGQLLLKQEKPMEAAACFHWVAENGNEKMSRAAKKKLEAILGEAG